jgi:hypothetical protein
MRTAMSRHTAPGVLAWTLLTSVALVLSVSPPALAAAHVGGPGAKGVSDRGGIRDTAGIEPRNVAGTSSGTDEKNARSSQGEAPGLVFEPAARAPGEVLVRVSAGVAASRRAILRSSVDATLAEKLPVRGLELLKVDGGVKVAVEALEGRPGVAYAEPNFVYGISATPDDPRLNELWGLHNTGQVVRG